MAIPVGAILAAVIGFLVIVGVGVGLYMIAPAARTGFGDGELPAGMPGAAVGAPDDDVDANDGVVGDTSSPAAEADNTDVTETQIATSVSVETPDNYEFLFDDCPKGLSANVVSASMTIGTCADECTKRENCGAFVITGCTTTKNCGGQCTLYTNNTTNIIPKSAFGNGLCSMTPGDMKLYRKKA